MKRNLNRRSFIKRSAAATAGAWISAPAILSSASPGSKLNIAVIGAGGKGRSDAQGVAGENIVALCDVDESRAAETFNKFPDAKRYKDYRVMLDKEKNLDAVVVSTPDHHHAPASIRAMQAGLHVYCQKPLAHSVYEAFAMRDTARRHGSVTQMGNQGTAQDGFRRGIEILKAGALGNVTEVHVWTNRPVWPQGIDRPTDTPAIPEGLEWDLWLGPAPERPYHSAYAPFSWRGWWDFGTGAIGDMACHTANLAYMGLGLTMPTRVEAESSCINLETAPAWSIIKYQFPARGNKPPVLLTWYSGGKQPSPDLAPGETYPNSGSLIVGDKGTLYSPNDYGSAFKLLPEKDFENYEGPTPTLPRSKGHYQEWIDGCKGGPRPLSNFEHAAPFTASFLLGIVAMRLGAPVEWDACAMKVKNAPAAESLIHRPYRQGWSW